MCAKRLCPTNRFAREHIHRQATHTKQICSHEHAHVIVEQQHIQKSWPHACLCLVIIARRIIDACNNLIESGVIVKTNGDEFKITIGEQLLEEADMGDPSTIK